MQQIFIHVLVDVIQNMISILICFILIFSRHKNISCQYLRHPPLCTRQILCTNLRSGNTLDTRPVKLKLSKILYDYFGFSLDFIHSTYPIFKILSGTHPIQYTTPRYTYPIFKILTGTHPIQYLPKFQNEKTPPPRLWVSTLP